jgi:heme A synthase
MPEQSTDLKSAGAPRSGAVLPSRAWRRIIIVSATVSILMGGLVSAAAQAFATESHPSHQDRLVKFERAGCQELQAFPKHGWVCVR